MHIAASDRPSATPKILIHIARTSCNTNVKDVAIKLEERSDTSPERVTGNQGIPITTDTLNDNIKVEDASNSILTTGSTSAGISLSMKNETSRNKESGEYLCERCNVSFKKKYNLERHLRRHTNDMLNCKLCSRLFYSKYDLAEHTNVVHGRKRYNCKHCNRLYKSKQSLKRHLSDHTGVFKYHCHICSKGFSYGHLFQEHINKHKNKKPYSCRKCSTKFSTARSCNFHSKICQTEPCFTCTICSRSFKHEKYLKSHQLRTHSSSKKKNVCRTSAAPHTMLRTTRSTTSISKSTSKKSVVIRDKHNIMCHSLPETCVTTSGTLGNCTGNNSDFPAAEKVCTTPGKFNVISHEHTNMQRNKSCNRSVETLQRHLTGHMGYNKYRCQMCSKRFDYLILLQEHIKKHKNIRPYSCGKCSSKFAAVRNSSLQKKNCNMVSCFTCTVCSRSFSNKKNLVSHHLRKHSLEKHYVCRTLLTAGTLLDTSCVITESMGCTPVPSVPRKVGVIKDENMPQTALATQGTLNNTITSKLESTSADTSGLTNANIENEGNFFMTVKSFDTTSDTCKTYQKTCSKIQQLSSTKPGTYSTIRNTPETTLETFSTIPEACGTNADTSDTMLDISGTKSGTSGTIQNKCSTRKYTCKTCNSSFSRKYNLERHSRKHTNDMLDCKLCDKVFYTKYELAEHTDTVHGGKRYNCEHCNRRYQTKQALQKHLAQHTSNYRYQCDVCFKGFSYSHVYRDHMNRHNNVEPYLCEKCSAKFTTARSFNFHKKICQVEPSLTCTICSRSFKHMKYLKGHSHMHFSPKQHVCCVCGRAFSHPGSLKKHEKNHHKQ